MFIGVHEQTFSVANGCFFSPIEAKTRNKRHKMSNSIHRDPIIEFLFEQPRRELLEWNKKSGKRSIEKERLEKLS